MGSALTKASHLTRSFAHAFSLCGVGVAPVLRALFVGITLCLLASLGAAPASAHAHRHATLAAKVTPPQATHTTKPAPRRLPCTVQRVVAREMVHPYHSHAPDHPHHRDAGHSPSDHSHPPSEDFVLHVMLHLSLDFTPHAEMMPALSRAPDGGLIARLHDAGSGITVLPPVPPPLS